MSSQGEAKCDLSKDSLTILPKLGEPIYFSLRDIVKVTQENYRITLSLTSNETLVLADLGYQYEDFLRQLLKERNRMVLSDELIKEEAKKTFSDIQYESISGKRRGKGECELKIYGDKLVMIPKNQEPVKIYLNEVVKVEDKDFSISIAAKEITVKLLQLGERHDQIVNLLSEVINASSANIQQTLQELFPTINPSLIRSASRLLKEGRTAKKADIEKISPKIWEEMEKKLGRLGVKEEYDYLCAKAAKDLVSIGLKKDNGIEFIWFLIPIDKKVIALESATAEDDGKATYFFRTEKGRVDETLAEINDAMIKSNFKREPVYFPDEKISGTPYEIALKKIPELKRLRSLFIGRVIHTSTETWQKNVDKLLISVNP